MRKKIFIAVALIVILIGVAAGVALMRKGSAPTFSKDGQIIKVPSLIQDNGAGE